MIISFFSNVDYTTGVDYSGHPLLLHQEDIDFDPETQIAELTENNGQYIVKISDMPETPENEDFQERRKRVFGNFITAETLEDFDWEGIELTEQDYNNLIILRNFSGDAGSQVAMLTKAIFKTLVLFMQIGVKKEQIAELFGPELIEVQKISETREALGLNPFDISFLTK